MNNQNSAKYLSGYIKQLDSLPFAPFFKPYELRNWIMEFGSEPGYDWRNGDKGHKEYIYNFDKLVSEIVKWGVDTGFLSNIGEDVYAPAYNLQMKDIQLGDIVQKFRGEYFTYHSLESRLSEKNIIKHNNATTTFMTQGDPGLIETKFGNFEFVHYDGCDYKETVYDKKHRIYVATYRQAYKDLKEINRNLDKVNIKELIYAHKDEIDLVKEAGKRKREINSGNVLDICAYDFGNSFK